MPLVGVAVVAAVVVDVESMEDWISLCGEIAEFFFMVTVFGHGFPAVLTDLTQKWSLSCPTVDNSLPLQVKYCISY